MRDTPTYQDALMEMRYHVKYEKLKQQEFEREKQIKMLMITCSTSLCNVLFIICHYMVPGQYFHILPICFCAMFRFLKKVSFYSKLILCFFTIIIEIERVSTEARSAIRAKIVGNDLEQPTDLDKWIVWIGWDDGQHQHKINGVILGEKIILTSYAPDLMNLPKSLGIVAYGETKMSNIFRTKENVINWSKSVNYISHVSTPNSTDIQVALIKLNHPMKLKSPDAEAISLPSKEPDENSECVVIGNGTKELSGYIVKMKAVIVHKSICKEEFPMLDEKSICIVMQGHIPNDSSVCSYYQIGSALICNGLLAGLVNWQPRCGSNTTICTNVFRLRNWIMKNTKKLNQVALYSKFAKYVVWYGRETSFNKTTQNGFGVILTKNIILTHHVKHVKQLKQGVAIYGYPYIINDDSNVTHVGWTNYTNYSNSSKAPRYEPQLSLIQLDEDINLDDDFASLMPLTRRSNLADKCVVLLYKYDMIFEAPVKIISEKECKRLLPNLYEHSICINWENVDKNFNHCKNLIAGSPLMCGNQLIGIVSEQIPCNYVKPRPCANVFKYRKWILIYVICMISNDNSAVVMPTKFSLQRRQV
uniref:Peptidase S1 domain-containing protein n=1 Tax=Glossina brevipalpis TaxID=37001 RepID=A0A1A9WYX5_9MUSC